MRFGAHVSIAGGVQEAPKNAAAIGCEVFQMFSRSPRGGPAPLLTKDVVAAFRTACEEHRQAAWYIHTPYYINLASGKATIRNASVRVIREELERGTALGATAVMTHIGSAKDMEEREAHKLVVQGLKKIMEGYKGTTQFLLEISAGAGMVIGDTFEELGELLRAVKDNVAICFDTQHAFGSGYDLRTPQTVSTTLAAFDNAIGLEHLRASHCNDSLVPLASHKDRHEHIGKGEIGLNGFRAIFGNRHFRKIDFLLETEPGGVVDDMKLLKKLRSEVVKGS